LGRRTKKLVIATRMIAPMMTGTMGTLRRSFVSRA
jgi:hypothetical protein